MKQRSAGKPDIEMGKKIRLRRVEQRISQSDLGEKLGVSFQQVQKYEKGVNRIGAGRLFDMARILGVPIDYFYESVAGQLAASRSVSEEEVAPPVMEFISSGEGLQLTLAFMRIKDVKVRKRVLDLVRSLADEKVAD